MSGYRIVQGPLPQGNYTIMSNAWIRDARLSWEARALLAWLISHDPTFTINEDTIINGGNAKRDKVRRMIAELEEYGYLVRSRKRGEGGKLGGVIYTITDPWVSVIPQVSAYDGKSVIGEPAPGHAESKPQVETKDGFTNVGSANVGPANVGSPAPIRRPTEEEKTKDQEDKNSPVAAVGSPTVSDARGSAPAAQPSKISPIRGRALIAAIPRYRSAPAWVRKHLMPLAMRGMESFGPVAIVRYGNLVAAEEQFLDKHHIPEFREVLRRLGRDVVLGTACALDGLDPADCPCATPPLPADRPWTQDDQDAFERAIWDLDMTDEEWAAAEEAARGGEA